VPLGGAKHTVINTILVFSFVALWHDLTFKLLAWGWLVSLFIIPELLARWVVSSAKVRCEAYLLDFVWRRFSLIDRLRTWLVDMCYWTCVMFGMGKTNCSVYVNHMEWTWRLLT